jgi:hypothetical protein
MRLSAKRIPPTTVILVAAIVVLACVVVREERKAARLRNALAFYKSQSHERVADCLCRRALLRWADDCPLEDVVEQIRLATSFWRWRAFPLGVPIRVDPIGLERAGQSLRSPVAGPPANLELTLGETLQAVLEPLGLAVDVRDASLVITARDMVMHPVRLRYPDEQ